jgi:hypothetical protein
MPQGRAVAKWCVLPLPWTEFLGPAPEQDNGANAIPGLLYGRATVRSDFYVPGRTRLHTLPGGMLTLELL